MAYEPSVEERILAALARIERKLDEVAAHVKTAEHEIHRVKVEARNKS